MKRKSYTAGLKLEVVKVAKESNNAQAARKYGVARKMVIDWRKQEEALKKVPKKQRARRSGTASWPELENALAKWVREQRQSGRIVTGTDVQDKAMNWARYNPHLSYGFTATHGWCSRFMKRKDLVLRRRTKTAQKLPVGLEDKLRDFRRCLRYSVSHFTGNLRCIELRLNRCIVEQRQCMFGILAAVGRSFELTVSEGSLVRRSIAHCSKIEDIDHALFSSPTSAEPRATPSASMGGFSVMNDDKKFHVTLDVTYFKRNEELEITPNDDGLMIHGNLEENKDDHGDVKREFTRAYWLPKRIGPERPKSNLSPNGLLTIEAARISRLHSVKHKIPIKGAKN